MTIKFQNTDTLEVKTYQELRGGRVNFPVSSHDLILGVWKRLEEGTKPTPDNEITHGVREIQPVDFVRQYEVYELPAEEQVANQEEADLIAAAEIEDAFNAEIAVIKSGYSEDEIKMWPVLEEEARGFDADSNHSTPMIDAVVHESGELKVDYVASIIVKADAYRVYSGAALGKKRKAAADLL